MLCHMCYRHIAFGYWCLQWNIDPVVFSAANLSDEVDEASPPPPSEVWLTVRAANPI